MNTRPQLPSPGGYSQAYSQSYTHAFETLAQSHLEAICRRSGARRLGVSSITLPFFGDDVIIDIPKRAVTQAKTTLAITDQLVILHYLIAALGTPCSDQLVSFKELPGGMVYYPTFYKRALAPIVTHFGVTPEGLSTAAAIIFGGTPVSLGDAATIIQALPHVRLTWVLWRGDDDFPADATVLFDSTINDYLPTEDIAVLCQSIALRLCR